MACLRRPKTDFVFKRIFGNEPNKHLLIELLNSLLELEGPDRITEITRRFINWRAFSFAFFVMLLISLVWEATLASPYGWWGYPPEAMMGIFIGAWSELPMEAVLVWLAVTFTTVIIYEVVKIWQSSGKSVGEAMVGPARGGR